MKKALSLLLALVLCLSLCACGGGNNTPKTTKAPTETATDFTKELTFGLWKKVLTNSATLLFNEDGTGTMSFFKGGSNTFKWQMSGTTISVITEQNKEYTYTVDSSKGYYRLLTDDGLSYVKETNYNAERQEVITQLSADAVEVDWETVVRDYKDNEVKAQQTYQNKAIKFTASPANISDKMFDIYIKTTLKSGFISVYMDSDLIASLDSDSTYVFVGYIVNSNLQIAGAFVAE